LVRAFQRPIYPRERSAERRIERQKLTAEALLHNPDLRIKEIAFGAGFESITNFNRVFKRLLGQSPTHYRTHLAAGQPT
jgi:AraC-like DNA-binding protein